jgi:hypothetical protein
MLDELPLRFQSAERTPAQSLGREVQVKYQEIMNPEAGDS